MIRALNLYMDKLLKEFQSFLCENYIFHVFCRINGTIPSNADIRDNVITFKGPVTYDMQGIYVCDATNSIGTRSSSVEVSIIGTFTWALYLYTHLQFSCCLCVC